MADLVLRDAGQVRGGPSETPAMWQGKIGDVFSAARERDPERGRSSHSFYPGGETPRDGPAPTGGSIKSASQNNRGGPSQRASRGGSPTNRAALTQITGDGLINLTYISESRIAASAIATEIESILAASSERNVRDQITGALLFTGTRFVQTLEGAAVKVDALLASIERDGRHTALAVIDRHDVAVRVFPRWSLTYGGPSLFIARTVARGLVGFDAGVSSDVARLLKMMVEFGTAPSLRSKH